MITKDNYIVQNYSNLYASISKIFYPKNYEDIFEVLNYAKEKKLKVLCIGSSLSWFDTILNTNNILINLKNFQRTFILDKQANILTVSTNYKVNEIIDKLSGKELSLYSLPGHLEVTIGGCVANDVHGKDTFKFGNFGENILEVEIVLANNEIVTCSNSSNKELFLSTIGGLGLTGIITKIKVNLKKISKYYETSIYPCKDYKELIKNLYQQKKKYDFIYGWLDTFKTKKNIGRGIIFKSRKLLHYHKKKKNNFYTNFTNKIKSRINGFIFAFVVKNNLVKYLNRVFYFLHLIIKKKTISTYTEIIAPIEDSSLNLKKNKLCPPYSFFEVQLILKDETLPGSLFEFLKKCQDLKLKGSIVGIKMHKKNNKFLSYAEDGVSININHIFKQNEKKDVIKKFKKLYEFIIKKNFKINIAKEFFFDKNFFFKNYKKANNFILIKKKYDKNKLFYSDFLDRINK